MWDWETHLPRLFNKYQLEDILNTYSCDDKQLIATSLYAAHFIDHTVLMDSSIQFDLFQNINVDYDRGFQKKFMNIMDDSITPEFKRKMREVFG